MLRVQPTLLSFALMLLALVLFTPALASAEEVRVEIRTIYAHDQGAADSVEVAPALAPMRDLLLESFPTYRHFEPIGDHALTIAEGESGRLELPDQGSTLLELTFHGTVEAQPPLPAPQSLFHLGLDLKDRIKTDVKVAPGATFFQAGLFYREGILILAIQASAPP